MHDHTPPDCKPGRWKNAEHMRFSRRKIAVFVFAAAFLFAFSETDAQPRIDVMVVGVSDGDTITVKDSKNQQIKVRLAGIDAPEKGQDFADRSKQNLSGLVFGKAVLLEGRKVDRYGRLVVKVLVNGIDINLQQVRSGLAWHFKSYESEQSAADRRLYASAELAARDTKLKIWSMPNPVAPWDFRRSGVQQNATSKTPFPRMLQGSQPGLIIGNRNSMIYHLPGCQSYSKVAKKNRVYFSSRAQAEAAGYRAARNC